MRRDAICHTPPRQPRSVGQAGQARPVTVAVSVMGEEEIEHALDLGLPRSLVHQNVLRIASRFVQWLRIPVHVVLPVVRQCPWQAADVFQGDQGADGKVLHAAGQDLGMFEVVCHVEGEGLGLDRVGVVWCWDIAIHTHTGQGSVPCGCPPVGAPRPGFIPLLMVTLTYSVHFFGGVLGNFIVN